ncbi:very short patch repair endonuclease [Rhizobium leguminosarum]|uniref:very short patch repair endonuclease n=1 Tax=Rhizobium leguminosarum TaxID=384 RepID=UPI00247A84C1|nr:very short patch repair endonuclease [Rhizobium leguminosarum]
MFSWCIPGSAAKTRWHVADIVDKQTRSRMMAGIKGKDTKPELMLRKALHARGFRFRLHAEDVPGRPDLVFAKHQAVVFVHGCFWHRHSDCRYATTPSTRPDFWRGKFDANIARDGAVVEALLDRRWRVATVWECALRKPDTIQVTVDSVCKWLLSDSRRLEVGEREAQLDQGDGHSH